MYSTGAAKALRHSARCFSTTASRQADFTHAVIGAGAVGLAIARRLQQVDGAQVVLIEKHGIVGSETSSRNSEVRESDNRKLDRLRSWGTLQDWCADAMARSYMLVYITAQIRSKLGYAFRERR